jgi:ribosome maturation factor RimP
MLQTGIQKNELFAEFAPLVEALGITLVDINRVDHGLTVSISIVIMTKDHEVTIAECSKVHKLVYPRLELKLAERELQLEVSTPGLQRSMRDYYELSLFTGKRVRIYEIGYAQWISGVIESSDEKSITLTAAQIGDSTEIIESMVVEFSKIQKAKLDYRWEDNSHGN